MKRQTFVEQAQAEELEQRDGAEDDVDDDEGERERQQRRDDKVRAQQAKRKAIEGASAQARAQQAERQKQREEFLAAERAKHDDEEALMPWEIAASKMATEARAQARRGAGGRR